MTRADIFREIRDLPLHEQFQVLESLARVLREDCAARPETDTTRSTLAQAAEALRSDYKADSELTVFTALDSEDFHATR
jgi:hypothetical protein